MSRRYWLPILAVVGLILTAHAQETRKGQGDAPRGHVASHAPKAQSQPAVPLAFQNSIEGIRTALESANKKGEAADEKRKSEEDRQAQLSMAASARQMYIVGIVESAITFAGVMLVLATLIYSKRAAEAARDAVTEAEKATSANRNMGEAQIRAYLTCEGATFVVEKDWLICRPIFKNYGQSPATKITFKGRATFITFANEIPHPGIVHKKTDPYETACHPIPAGGTGRTILLWPHTAFGSDYERIKNSAHFGIEGHLTWRDVFGGTHTTPVILFDGGDKLGFGGEIIKSGDLSAYSQETTSQNDST